MQTNSELENWPQFLFLQLAFVLLALFTLAGGIFCGFAEVSEFASGDDDDVDLDAMNDEVEALYEEYTDAEVDEALKAFIFQAGGGGVTQEQVDFVTKIEVSKVSIVVS